MKKMWVLFCAFFLFVISSCSNLSDANLRASEYTLMVGDMLPFGLENKKIEDYEISNSFTLYEQKGYVVANNKGESRLTLTYEDETTHEISFEVEDRVIKDVDASSNKKILNELTRKLDTYKVKLKQSNSYSLSINDAKTPGGKEVLAIRANPLQIDFKEETLHRHVVKEDNKFYLYQETTNDTYTKTEYADDDEELNLKLDAQFYYFDTEGMFNFNFDVENGKIYKNDDYYILHAYYKDLINDEIQEAVEEALKNEFVNINSLLYSVATMYFRFTENNLIFGVTVAIRDDYYILPVTIAYRFDLDGVQMTDINSLNIVDKKAESIEEVKTETDLLAEPIVLGATEPRTQYYLTTLEKGQYVINHNAAFEYNVFDEDGKLLNVNYMDGYYDSFYIKEDGKYYFRFDKNNYSNSSVYISKCNYETEASISEPLFLETKEFELEGGEDMEYYVVVNTSSTDEYVVVTNTGENAFNILAEHKDSINGQSRTCGLEANNQAIIRLKRGVNKFIVNSLKETKASYSMDVKQVENLISANSFETAKAFEEGAAYTVMGDYEFVLFRLEILETGYYSYELDFIDNKQLHNMVIYTKDELEIPQADYYKLQPGIYYLRIWFLDFDDYDFCSFKLTEEKNIIKKIEETITLPSISNLENYRTELIYNRGEVSKFNEYTYYFELSEESSVLVDAKVELYYGNGEPVITRYYSRFYLSRENIIVKLAAGKYMVKPIDSLSNFVIGIVNVPLESYYYGGVPIELVIGKSYTVKQDFDCDIEFFTFTVEEKGTYKINAPLGQIYDDSGRTVLFYTYGCTIDLEPGVQYYFVLDYDSLQEETISIEKVK